MQYGNAGSNYYEQTTNLLNYSNGFDQAAWQTDGNVLVQQNTTSPTGDTDAWSLTGITSGSDSAYVYQNIAILKAGATYTNMQTVNVTGSGTGATFDITVTGTSYLAVVNEGGEFYVNGSELRIPGIELGGVNGTNDCFLTITSLAGSAVLAVTVTGTVPANSNLNYTMSMYVKEGTASSVEMAAIFSGVTTVSTYVNFNFASNIFTIATANGGASPLTYNKLELEKHGVELDNTYQIDKGRKLRVNRVNIGAEKPYNVTIDNNSGDMDLDTLLNLLHHGQLFEGKTFIKQLFRKSLK
jgi:hypothetical protein